MSKPTRPKNTEQTSEAVASIAGRLLNNQSLRDLEAWLWGIALWDTTSDDLDKHNANAGLALLQDVKRLAASALTQKG